MTEDEKIRYLFNRKLEYRMHIQGIIIQNKIMIARSKSRWKKLGSFDWHSYYGLNKLCDALESDKLDEYALNQDLNNKRKVLAVPVNNSRTRGIVYEERKK